MTMTVRIQKSGRARLAVVAVLALLAVVATFGMPNFSGATYTSTTGSKATVTAADDWTPPIVAVRPPAESVQGVVSLAVDASDARSSIESVVIELAARGGSWTTLCTTAKAPYRCDWDTRAGGDGRWSVRAVATDTAGYSTTSAVVTTTVANAVVSLDSPRELLRGTVPLTARLEGAGSAAYAVRIEYAPAGTSAWETICSREAAPYTCDWTTTSAPSQHYDLRAVATSDGATHVSKPVRKVLVDNTPPTVALQLPIAVLRGTTAFDSVAADSHSGVARVEVQYSSVFSSTFTELCTVTAEPWSCTYDTNALPAGLYTFRAVATDVAGNTETSANVVRAIDDSVAVSLVDPGPHLGGVVTLNATASSPLGILSVRIQRSRSGADSWTDVCTGRTSPYSCSWDTSTVPDGSYDLRAVLTDRLGRTTVSAIVTSRQVDNTPVRGLDVQTVSRGALAGLADAGDQMTFLYSEAIALSTIKPGWTGSPTPVTLRLRDGILLGTGSAGDTADVLINGSASSIGSVNLHEDYVSSLRNVQLDATLTASTATIDGTPATLLTVTIAPGATDNRLRTVNAGSTMVWTPSTTVTDLGGRNGSAARTAETGALDREF
jgi:hypothetical protein